MFNDEMGFYSNIIKRSSIRSSCLGIGRNNNSVLLNGALLKIKFGVGAGWQLDLTMDKQQSNRALL